MPQAARALSPDRQRPPALPPEALKERVKNERQPVNVGEPPIFSLKVKGKLERHGFCEDAKIKDPEHGLLFVGDGVSGGDEKKGIGAIASRLTAESIQAHLGATLDQEIENLMAAEGIPESARQGKVDAFIEASFRTALAEADQAIQRVKKANEKDDAYKQCATTASLGKIVLMKDGTSVLYYANIGDSRQYLQRNGELHKLTTDDSLAAAKIRQDLMRSPAFDLTTEQGRQNLEDKFESLLHEIEQAEDPDKLHPYLKALFQERNKIYRAVGDGKSHQDVRIKKMILKPGDRYVLVSDGKTDQSTEEEMAKELLAYPDDREAEREMQESADAIGRKNTSPRAKNDDISVIVHTIEEAAELVEEQPEQSKVQKELPPSKETIDEWKFAQATIDRQIVQLALEYAAATDVDVRREVEIDLAECRIQQATYEYHLSKAEKDTLTAQIPERFAESQPVKLPKRLIPGRSATWAENWIVQDYDPSTEQYLVISKAGEPTSVDRYELESAQEKVFAKIGDELMVKVGGKLEPGWIVDEVNAADVILSKGDQHKRASVEVVSNTLKESILRGFDLRTRMQRALEQLGASKEKKAQLKEQKRLAEEQKARARAKAA